MHVAWSSGLSVGARREGGVPHSGSIALPLLANLAGLAKELSTSTTHSIALGHLLAAGAASSSRAMPRPLIPLR